MRIPMQHTKKKIYCEKVKAGTIMEIPMIIQPAFKKTDNKWDVFCSFCVFIVRAPFKISKMKYTLWIYDCQ